MLKVRDLNVHYGNVQAVRDVSIDIQDDEFVTIIGNNGAGKTTLLLTLSGLLKPTSGTIELSGTMIDKLPPHTILSMGMAQVPQERWLFPDMTVADNLELGTPRGTDKEIAKQRLEEVYSDFEVLAKRMNQKAGTLSGGEQQMLTIARALMIGPKVLLLDEPSSGLAPIIVQNLARIITNLNKGGLTILFVEQNAQLALEIADRAYIMENSSITTSGKASDLLRSDSVRKAYLGLV